jgi:hypothetical protein
MQKISTLLIAVIFLLHNAAAQEQDKNIIIQQTVEEYKFVKGNKDNPVQVKQTLENIYRCDEFRTSIPVVEFYNNQIEINDVDIWINGDRQKGFSPAHDSYTVDGIFYSDAKKMNDQ